MMTSTDLSFEAFSSRTASLKAGPVEPGPDTECWWSARAWGSLGPRGDRVSLSPNTYILSFEHI